MSEIKWSSETQEVLVAPLLRAEFKCFIDLIILKVMDKPLHLKSDFEQIFGLLYETLSDFIYQRIIIIYDLT